MCPRTPAAVVKISPRVSIRRRRDRAGDAPRLRRPRVSSRAQCGSRDAKRRGTRSPLMRASTAAWHPIANLDCLRLPEHDPCAGREWRCSTLRRAVAPYIHPTSTARHRATPCGTVRHRAAPCDDFASRLINPRQSALVRINPSHAGSSRIGPRVLDAQVQQFLEIDLHAETTNHLDVRQYRGILHHACG